MKLTRIADEQDYERLLEIRRLVTEMFDDGTVRLICEHCRFRDDCPDCEIEQLDALLQESALMPAREDG